MVRPFHPDCKDASAVWFDEHNTRLHPTDTVSPSALILAGTEPLLPEPTTCVDIADYPHLSTTPFTVSLQLPPQGAGLGCIISTETYHILPYVSSFTPGTPLSQQFLQHG